MFFQLYIKTFILRTEISEILNCIEYSPLANFARWKLRRENLPWIYQ